MLIDKFIFLICLGCSKPGYYGMHCSYPCPKTCQESCCNIVDGTCLGCVDGYTGPTCKEGNIIRIKIIHLQNKAKPETYICRTVLRHILRTVLDIAVISFVERV